MMPDIGMVRAAISAVMVVEPHVMPEVSATARLDPLGMFIL